MSLPPRTKTRLRRLAAKYETAAFVDGDPIRFLHTAKGTGIETMAFVAACLRYGSRKQFLPKIQALADMAEAFPGDPCRGDFALYGLGIDEE